MSWKIMIKFKDVEKWQTIVDAGPCEAVDATGHVKMMNEDITLSFILDNFRDITNNKDDILEYKYKKGNKIVQRYSKSKRDNMKILNMLDMIEQWNN